MDYTIRFSPAVRDEINEVVETAIKVWAEACPTLSGLAITAGNYAGYGAYQMRCHSSGIIEIPIGNHFSLLSVNSKNELVHHDQDKRLLLGVVMHEVGHHVVNTAREEPWKDNSHVGQSTHLRREWVWICCTAWNAINNLTLDCNAYANAARSDKALRDHLPQFNPYFPPVFEPSHTVCDHCGATIETKRSNAKFCSAKCRLAAHRKRQGSQCESSKGVTA